MEMIFPARKIEVTSNSKKTEQQFFPDLTDTLIFIYNLIFFIENYDFP